MKFRSNSNVLANHW